MLRNPATRAFSHFLMSCRQGYEHGQFEDAIELEKDRIGMGKSLDDKRHFSYVDRGYYGKQIDLFLKFFPKENMLFIVFEEFMKNPEEQTKAIFEFLGVTTDIPIEFSMHSNEGYSLKYKYLNKFLSGYFQGSFKSMVSFFVKKNDLSMQEMEEILKIIDKEKTEK